MYYKHRRDLKLFLQLGTGSKEKILDIQMNNLSIGVVGALPVVHYLSGCNSTNSFRGIGKVKFFKTECKDKRYCSFNTWIHHKDTVVDILKELFCDVYGATNRIDTNSVKSMKWFRFFFNAYETLIHFFTILNEKYTPRSLKSRRNCFEYVNIWFFRYDFSLSSWR